MALMAAWKGGRGRGRGRKSLSKILASYNKFININFVNI